MKTLKTLILLLIYINSNAQLKPLAELELGYKNMNATIGKDGKWVSSNLRRYWMYSNVILGVKNEKFELGTNIENYFGYEEGTSFTPKQITYNIFAKYTIKKITFTYEHFCSHPIISKVSDIYLHNDAYYTNAYDKLTIKYKLL